MTAVAPQILVTGSRRLRLDMFLISQALRCAGATPRIVFPGEPVPNKTHHGLHGVVIAGGDHVHPERYRQKPTIKAPYNLPRDSLEIDVLDMAARDRLPVLGICRGAQLINVHRGGDLYQNITSQRQHTHARRLLLPNQVATIAPRSRISRVMRRHKVGINRLHSQAINVLGRGLQVVARDQDHFVQSIETCSSDQWLLGVQWHPEYLLYHAAHRRLFFALVSAARRYQQQHSAQFGQA